MSSEGNNRLLFLGLLILLGLIGVGAVLFSTAWGIGVSPDSVRYIDAARNLAARHALVERQVDGSFTPMSDVHPMFPALLGVIHLAGGPDPWITARWLNALLFGANVVLIGLMVYHLTDGSIWPALAGSLLTATSLDMLKIHAMAWTEPLFLFFGFSSLLLLSVYLRGQDRRILAAASLSAALAFFDRHVGLSLIVTGIIVLVLSGRSNYKRRAGDAIVFAVVGSLPSVLWIARNLRVTGRLANRAIGFHVNLNLLYRTTRLGLDTISLWLLPEALSVRIRIVIIVFVIVTLCGLGIWWLTKVAQKRQWSTVFDKKAYLAYSLLIFSVFYAGLLMFTLLFHYASTPLDYRLLSPLYVVMLVLVVTWLNKLFLLQKQKSGRVAALIVLFFLLFMASYLWRAAVWVVETHENGLGFASKSWQQSELIQQIREMDDGVKVYTNAVSPVYFLTEKLTYGLPIKVNALTGTANQRLNEQLALVQQSLEAENAFLAYFNNVSWWAGYLLSEEELRNLLSLELVKRSADGAIYKAKERFKE